MSGVTDTHRRARLRGRAGVARWRVEGASWVGWLYATGAVLGVGGALVQRDAATAVSAGAMVAWAASMGYGIHRMRAGSRVAACAVVGLFLGAKALSGDPLAWTLWDAATGALLVNGAWGVFQLARVEREAATLPPAPEPVRRFGRAFG